MHPRAPLLLSILGLALTGYAAWLGSADTSCFERAATILLGSISLLSIAAASGSKLRLQRGLAMTLLALMMGMAGNSLFDAKLFALDLFSDPRYATFLVGLLALNIFGLWRGSFLARWLSIALAGGGILSSGLNLAPYASLPNQYTWMLATSLAGAVLILANLIGSKQREHFERDASPLWSSPDPLLRSIRLTMMSFMAAIPLLLVYTWMQPIVPSTAATALPLAIFLSAAILASARRMIIGAVALALGGGALLVQTVATVIRAHEIDRAMYEQFGAVYGNNGDISLYYAAFWAPAGIAALATGVRIAAPILRLLTDRE